MSSTPADARHLPPPEPNLNASAALLRAMTRFEREKVQPWIALRNAIGIAAPLAAGVAIGAAPSGLIATTGALNVSFSDGSDPYLLRVQRLLIASVLTGVAVTIGATCGGNEWLAIAAPILWAAGAGLLVALDPAAADIGLISLVTLVIFVGQPMPPEHALYAGALAFSGGLLQTSLSVALWPFRRYEPERRVLGALFREIARASANPAPATVAPPATAQTIQAQKTLAGLARMRTIQGERYLALLNQAERIRLSLMVLARLRTRLARESETSREADIISGCFDPASRILAATAESVQSGKLVEFDPKWLEAVRAATEALRTAADDRQSKTALRMVEDARRQLDALTGQLRAAVELSTSSSPVGREAFERREALKPWRLRLEGTLATLRANISLRSVAFQHALRLSFCIGIGYTIARALQLPRSYWVPMTIAIVLKPDFTSTFSRGLLRLVGTALGLVLATALFELTPPGLYMDVLLIGIFGFLMRCFGPANYGIVAVAISAMVVLMFAVLGDTPGAIIAERAWNTLIGGALPLLVYAAWPSWERRQVPSRLAALLDSYRIYFRAIRENYVQPERLDTRELDRARMEARLARSNLEASVERYASEPRASAGAVRLLNAVLANSHRLVHAIMALEAGLFQSRPVPARPQFVVLANHVELTLHSLAAVLRGSPLRKSELPDLREDHNALISSGDSATERYALVNVETDRITNSLNTVTGLVLDYARHMRSSSFRTKIVE